VLMSSIVAMARNAAKSAVHFIWKPLYDLLHFDAGNDCNETNICCHSDDVQACVHGPPSSLLLLIARIQSLTNCLHSWMSSN